MAGARSRARLFPRPYWVLLSGEAVQSVGHGMVVPFLALYLTETIGASATEAGFVLALWAVIGLFGQPVGGVLADRLGRRPVILGGLAISAAATIAFGLASSVWAVAFLVVAWGAGFAVFEPAAELSSPTSRNPSSEPRHTACGASLTTPASPSARRSRHSSSGSRPFASRSSSRG